MPSNTDTTWFITGRSTGLGARSPAVCWSTDSAQWSPPAIPSRFKTSSPRTRRSRWPSALDVTNPRQVTEAVAHAERAFGAIDVLVNNAGYGYLAAVEEGEDHEVRAMFEANFFGLAALIRRVLPGMVRGRGHIINISSVGGPDRQPQLRLLQRDEIRRRGAVRGAGEGSRAARHPRHLVIEPGPFRTDWAGRSLKQPRHPIQAYANTSGARRAVITGRSGKQPGDPVRAADAIIKVVESWRRRSISFLAATAWIGSG
jgi:NAD(P)-dependent dehydrogenase (short-subunit alcohol dehydrogenase family)